MCPKAGHCCKRGAMDFSEFCDRLLERTDIVKLISRYVTLKRAGSSFKACCPFHNERTPSFSVDPAKQLYHCFGCGKGGNAITFLRDIENIDTIDAIKMLADEAHMELPSFRGASTADWIRKSGFGCTRLCARLRGTTTRISPRRERRSHATTSKNGSCRQI